jgi:hypothetical protein
MRQEFATPAGSQSDDGAAHRAQCASLIAPYKSVFCETRASVGRNNARALVGRRLDDAHVCNNDAQTFGETNPGLRLAPYLTRGSRAVEKGRCHCKVATKGGDHGPRQGSGKAGGRTRRPERCDVLIAVQILRLTVAHRARIIAEYFIECRDVVGDQRPLVPFKGCSNFCNHIRTIDLQFVAPRQNDAALTSTRELSYPPE